MVYRYTKTTEYTKFDFRKLQTSILTHKKGLPYWWLTGIRRLQGIQNLFRKLQLSIIPYKKGLPYWWYTGIRRLQRIQNLFRKLKKSIFTQKKGPPYWLYTGIRRLKSIHDLILENFKHQFYLTKRGFHIDGVRVYED